MNADFFLDIYTAFRPYAPAMVTLLAFSAASVTSIHVLLSRRSPGSSIAWIALVWLAPLLGVISYLTFGINRIRRRAESLRPPHDSYRAEPIVDAVSPDVLADLLPTSCSQMQRLQPLVDRVVSRPLLPGSKLTPLIDGDETFPAMLNAINGAQNTINLASYIFDNDNTGRQFISALEAAQKRGVEVRILVDAAGLRYSFPSAYSRFKQAKLRAVRFHPSLFPPHVMTINLRNHRKIMVVDGKLGFTGGVNIRSHHIIKEKHRSPARDLHFKVEGPVVAHLQEVFVDDWHFASKEELRGIGYFPPLERVGDSLARGIPDGPDENLDKLRWTILGAITSARSSVRIMTPYFIPDQSIVAALTLAALREVDVEIILPSHNNLPLVHWACMAHLRPILGWGCKVFFTDPPFDHTKLMVVDDIWILCGSANMDPRSLRLNFEFNLECWSHELAEDLNEFIDSRLDEATELTLEEYDSRSRILQLRDAIAALLSPYL